MWLNFQEKVFYLLDIGLISEYVPPTYQDSDIRGGPANTNIMETLGETPWDVVLSGTGLSQSLLAL